jgi:hypothetical protein
MRGERLLAEVLGYRMIVSFKNCNWIVHGSLLVGIGAGD